PSPGTATLRARAPACAGCGVSQIRRWADTHPGTLSSCRSAEREVEGGAALGPDALTDAGSPRSRPVCRRWNRVNSFVGAGGIEPAPLSRRRTRCRGAELDLAHRDIVTAAAFGPDGARVVTGQHRSHRPGLGAAGRSRLLRIPLQEPVGCYREG